MPLYEYVCQACGKKTEVLQGMKERPLRTCPDCGGKLKKAFSAPAIQFKGSGFYTTDYARGTNQGKSGSTPPKAESDSKSSESKESKASEAKPSDSKPAAKPDSKKTSSKD